MTHVKRVRYSKDNSKILQTFDCYRCEMDTRNDKFERIVKLSRDITINSKRIIFNLHRILPHASNHAEILNEALAKLQSLRTMFDKIGAELQGEDVYQYHRAFTNGVQEFIEACSFYHVIKHLTIVHPSIVRDFMGTCPLLDGDYFLGLADLTGEVMRMCISFCSKGENGTGFRLRELLYQVNAGLTTLNVDGKGMNQKIEVMLNSLQKCEKSNYTVSVRSAEFPEVCKELMVTD